MIRFAETCEAIAATSATSAKVLRLAEYFEGLDDVNLEAASRFFTGGPFAPSEQRTLAIGGTTFSPQRAASGKFQITNCRLITAPMET